MSKFEQLLSLNVNDKTEKKGDLTYLSWSFAWGEFKKVYPEAVYEVIKFDGLPYAYDENTGYMVYTKVTAENLTHEMWLPVMDGKNDAMKAQLYTYKAMRWNKQSRKKEEVEVTVQGATMFDVNKTIMRCLVKNLAMFGLGLYIYAGEDLPEPSEEEKAKQAESEKQEILEQYDGGKGRKPEEYYAKSIDAITTAIDLKTLEVVWKFVNGWRSFMKRENYITEAESKDLLQAYQEKKAEFENV